MPKDGQAKKKDSSVKEILDYPGAKEAFDQLAHDKVDQRMLQNLLTLRRILGDAKASRISCAPRRVLHGVIAKLNTLAAQVSDLERYPGIPTEFFATAETLLRIDHRVGSLPPRVRIAALLREYAHILERATSKRYLKLESGSRNPSICRLLEFVKKTTGRFHYEEVAALLNAVDDASRNCKQPRWDVASLRQLTYRERVRSKKRHEKPWQGPKDS